MCGSAICSRLAQVKRQYDADNVFRSIRSAILAG
ncbi:MAG: BBE domain-containing protein [Pseudonocardiaceae bacterium]